jgi:hypothetical protein
MARDRIRRACHLAPLRRYWTDEGQTFGEVRSAIRRPGVEILRFISWATLEIGQCLILGRGLGPSLRQILRNQGHDHAPPLGSRLRELPLQDVYRSLHVWIGGREGQLDG